MKPVASSVDELLAGATAREPMEATDSKSGATFERVVIDGERYVVKHVGIEDDWIARAMGDVGRWPLLVWSSGLLDRMPAHVDHTYAGAARDGASAALLMRDVEHWLVPAGDAPISVDEHCAFLRDLAALHASFWGWEDHVGLTPLVNRFFMFSPWVIACEEARGFPEPVPVIARDGWLELAVVAPAMSATLEPLRLDPTPVAVALERTPLAFCHGDAKMGNLGRGPDGRLILIDWANPGRSAGCLELAHYLALNLARIPTGFAPEASIEEYRAGLEARGIETAGWWERQLALGLLGIMVQLGWEKALGPSDDLRWWEERVAEGARLLR